MADEEIPKKTPHDALIEALEHVDEMQDVLIIYEGVDDKKCGSFDSDITIAQSLWMMKLFETWTMLHALGQKP